MDPALAKNIILCRRPRKYGTTVSGNIWEPFVFKAGWQMASEAQNDGPNIASDCPTWFPHGTVCKGKIEIEATAFFSTQLLVIFKRGKQNREVESCNPKVGTTCKGKAETQVTKTSQ